MWKPHERKPVWNCVFLLFCIARASGNLFASRFSFFFPRASERRVLPIVGVCISSSHLHIFSSSHLLILKSSHHLHIFTSSHLHIFSSSRLLIFTSSHLHIFTSSHLLIFTSAHLHIFASSHLLIFTSSHPYIFTSSHLHIFSSCLLASCPLALTSSHLLLLSSCPLALSVFSISLLKAGAGAVPTRRHETQPFRTKWGSIAKNWGKIAISTSPAQPSFARNEVRSRKTEIKLQFLLCVNVSV